MRKGGANSDQVVSRCRGVLGPGELHTLAEFLSARLKDWPCVGAAAAACRALLQPQPAPGGAEGSSGAGAAVAPLAELRDDSALLILEATAEMLRTAQSFRQDDRSALLSLLLAAARGWGGLAASRGVPLLDAFLGAADGEKDPRCLLAAFEAVRALCAMYHAPGADPSPLRQLADEVADWAAAYFPISFNPPPPPAGAAGPPPITRAMLASGLEAALRSSPFLAGGVVPLLLEKLSSTYRPAKEDALSAMRACCPAYGPDALAPHTSQLWSALRSEVLAPCSAGGCGAAAPPAPAPGGAGGADADPAVSLAMAAAGCLTVVMRAAGPGSMEVAALQDSSLADLLLLVRGGGAGSAAQAASPFPSQASASRADRRVLCGAMLLAAVCAAGPPFLLAAQSAVLQPLQAALQESLAGPGACDKYEQTLHSMAALTAVVEAVAADLGGGGGSAWLGSGGGAAAGALADLKRSIIEALAAVHAKLGGADSNAGSGGDVSMTEAGSGAYDADAALQLRLAAAAAWRALLRLHTAAVAVAAATAASAPAPAAELLLTHGDQTAAAEQLCTCALQGQAGAGPAGVPCRMRWGRPADVGQEAAAALQQLLGLAAPSGDVMQAGVAGGGGAGVSPSGSAVVSLLVSRLAVVSGSSSGGGERTAALHLAAQLAAPSDCGSGGDFAAAWLASLPQMLLGLRGESAEGEDWLRECLRLLAVSVLPAVTSRVRAAPHAASAAATAAAAHALAAAALAAAAEWEASGASGLPFRGAADPAPGAASGPAATAADAPSLVGLWCGAVQQLTVCCDDKQQLALAMEAAERIAAAAAAAAAGSGPRAPPPASLPLACAVVCGLRPPLLAPASTLALADSLLQLLAPAVAAEAEGAAAAAGPVAVAAGGGSEHMAAAVALAAAVNRWQDAAALDAWLGSALQPTVMLRLTAAAPPGGSSGCGASVTAARVAGWVGRALALRNHASLGALVSALVGLVTGLGGGAATAAEMDVDDAEPEPAAGGGGGGEAVTPASMAAAEAFGLLTADEAAAGSVSLPAAPAALSEAASKHAASPMPLALAVAVALLAGSAPRQLCRQDGPRMAPLLLRSALRLSQALAGGRTTPGQPAPSAAPLAAAVGDDGAAAALVALAALRGALGVVHDWLQGLGPAPEQQSPLGQVLAAVVAALDDDRRSVRQLAIVIVNDAELLAFLELSETADGALEAVDVAVRARKGSGKEEQHEIVLGIRTRDSGSLPEESQLLEVLAWLLPHTADGAAGEAGAPAAPAAEAAESGPTQSGFPTGSIAPPRSPTEQHKPPPLHAWLSPAAGISTTPAPAASTAAPLSPSCSDPRSPTAGPRSPAAAAAVAGGGSPAGAGAPSAGTALDVGWLYRAVKPSGTEPQWDGNPPELRPQLRPYQRRAVAWMLRRERHQEVEEGEGQGQGAGLPAAGAAACAAPVAGGHPVQRRQPPLHPLWRRLLTLPSGSSGGGEGCGGRELYVNPYSGALASAAFPAPPAVRGGILADEMGLGKTVELLALITANRFDAGAAAAAAEEEAEERNEGDEPGAAAGQDGEEGEDEEQPSEGGGGRKRTTAPAPPPRRRRRKRPERVDCPCGLACLDMDDPAVEEYGGLWILCDGCNAWMHGACVGVRRSPRGAWVCSKCLAERAAETVSEPCGATLIVVPSAILQQWYDEIRRHVHPGALRVVVYGGQTQPGTSSASSGLIAGALAAAAAGGGGAGRRGRRAGEDSGGDVAESLVVSAPQLAAADVVLTTYDVLKRDLARQPDPQQPGEERTLRRGKRYAVVPTPLTRLVWWRVVLDEAQMVESSTAKAAEMALKLDTVHRWCVTGTPISRGLEDLFGLMAFLGARPWAERRWWQRCVQRPAEAGQPAGRDLLLRLLRPTSDGGAGPVGGRGGPLAFAAGGGERVVGGGGGGLLWRSAKRDVESELGLPPQSADLVRLRLNAVELHFYNRQHQDCAAKARAVLPARVVSAMESGRLALAAEERAEAEAARADGETVAQAAPAAAAEAVEAALATAAVADMAGAAARAGEASGAGCAQDPAIGPQAMDVDGREGEAGCGTSSGSGGGAIAPEPTVASALEQRQQRELEELHLLHRRRWEQAQAAEAEAAAAAVAAAATEEEGTEAGAGHLEDVDIGAGDDGGAGAGREGEEEGLHGAGGEELAAGGRGRGRRGGGGGGGRKAPPPPLSELLNRQLTAREARKLLGPLLKLRQACCHPQVGSGGIRALGAAGGGPAGAHAGQHHHHGHAGGPGGRDGPMSMLEILAVLVTRAKVEAEEAQRVLVAALNGLAALLVIQRDVPAAVAAYRTALRTMDDNKPDIGADPLQRLHTLHNLAAMLAAPAAASVPRTLRDDSLGEEAAAIRSRYLEQRRGKVAADEAEYRELREAASPFTGATGWYIAAIDLLMEGGGGTAAAEHTDVNASSMAHRFSSLLGLKPLLNQALDAIEEHRAEALRCLEALGARAAAEQPDPDFVEQAGQCGRCRSGPSRALVCEHCRLDERFIQWEVRLFALYSRALTAGATVTAEEAARRAQAAMVRWAGRGGLNEDRGADEEGAEDDDEAGRRGANVALAATSWRQSEAEMVGESIAAHEGNLKLHPAAVPVKSVELTNDRITAEADLRKTMGTLRYLRKLQTIQTAQQQRQQRQQEQQERQEGKQKLKEELPQEAVAAGTAADGSAGLVAAPAAGGDAVAAAGGAGPCTSTAQAPYAPPATIQAKAEPTSTADAYAADLGAPAPTPAAAAGNFATPEPELEVEVCPICHDPIDLTSGGPSVILPCGHQLHPPCCEALVAKIHVADIAYIDTGPTRRSSGGAPGGSDAGVAGAGVGPWAGESAVSVRGSFGTKIEATVRRIKFVLGQDPAAKVLVFSSWVDLLELVWSALSANGVHALLARGRGGMAAALAAFKDHPGDLDALEGLEGLDEAHEDAGAEDEVAGGAAEGIHAGWATPPHPSQLQTAAADTPTAGGTTTAGLDAAAEGMQRAAVGGVGSASAVGGRTPIRGSRRGAGPLSSPSKQAAQAKPRVLLLQLKQGGAGLNLTEAQHVVLMEPQLDPAAEAQAVGRVHRIGQSRPTHVHRFVVEHTVEEQVHKLATARARGMDMAVAVAAAARGHGGGGHRVAGGGDGSEHLTVRDVAVLLDNRWGAATAAEAEAEARRLQGREQEDQVGEDAGGSGIVAHGPAAAGG
ncbi:hypothetical protein GPECTOR_8g26 [Gonium pectorale]|uniref:PHD-type domain-containing protein n=1 Tax=Gonium pectorale TaxID=33097 RepID=A0A150GSM6_GONPE|nr:hypothetical protein GPECTOR_8g26 [Gonium pectorale]|eukprot:KXZ52879.1 hypothetical protein GPECTOR_8g26 [Gonium pectorale]